MTQAAECATTAECDESTMATLSGPCSSAQAHSPMNVQDRAAALTEEIKKITEGKVLNGPFKGLLLPDIKGIGSPFYLGTYEHELQSVIREIIYSNYGSIFNAGCSFGYYAAGLARLLPSTKVYASDIDEQALKLCEYTKQINGIDNLHISVDWFTNADLIIMDIEGNEEELLVPGDYDVLVESHECIKPGITQKLIDRFYTTHDIEIIHNHSTFFDLQQLFPGIHIEHFDYAIASWEGRAGQTPWLWMRNKNVQKRNAILGGLSEASSPTDTPAAGTTTNIAAAAPAEIIV